MFSWAKYRTAKNGIKIYTSFDSNTMMSDIINITEDRYGLTELFYPSDTIVVEDRAYFDFLLILARIKGNNYFVTRIKVNTVYEVVKELDLLEDKDQDILKEEIIVLSSPKAVKTTINKHLLRLITVYKPDENKVIGIITNNLEWSARTITDLYKKRWGIELFFKAIKQDLQVKTFIGTSENAVKPQIYVALITYLLLQLIIRTVIKQVKGFSSLVEKIRICLLFYLTLDYVYNQVSQGAKRIKQKKQAELMPKLNLFS